MKDKDCRKLLARLTLTLKKKKILDDDDMNKIFNIHYGYFIKGELEDEFQT